MVNTHMLVSLTSTKTLFKLSASRQTVPQHSDSQSSLHTVTLNPCHGKGLNELHLLWGN